MSFLICWFFHFVIVEMCPIGICVFLRCLIIEIKSIIDFFYFWCLYICELFIFLIIDSVEEKPPTIFKKQKSKMRPGRITQKSIMKTSQNTKWENQSIIKKWKMSESSNGPLTAAAPPDPPHGRAGILGNPFWVALFCFVVFFFIFVCGFQASGGSSFLFSLKFTSNAARIMSGDPLGPELWAYL